MRAFHDEVRDGRLGALEAAAEHDQRRRDADSAEALVRTFDIEAAPETVFAFFVDADKLTRWLERGIDSMSAVWNVFDVLPSGRGDWVPDNTYPGATRG